MDHPFHFGAVKVPAAVRKAMWAAHDALTEKQAHVARLETGKQDLEAQIATERQTLEGAKQAYVASFADAAKDADTLPAKANELKTHIATMSATIAGYENTLSDFGEAIRLEKNKMYPLRQAFLRARHAVVKEILNQVPTNRTPGGKLNGLLEFIDGGGQIDLGNAIMMFIAANDDITTEVGQYPTGDLKNPTTFFNFLSMFFAAPTKDDIAVFRARFDALIWGNRKPPARIKLPEKQRPENDPQAVAKYLM